MPTFTENEISIDLIRWKENEKIPMMDLLYLHLILWAKENDYQIFNLGMAPLSSSYERTNGLLGTITTSIYQHSSSLYSFKGLRQYKNKFKPEWSPRYLVYPRRLLISQALMKSYKVIHPK
jgi:phosphatidylglycerol lysyltransferase